MSERHIHLDYVGHADTTKRLLEVDPEWFWEPFAISEAGLPLFDQAGGLSIKLTVAGVTRIGYGDQGNGKGAKEAIGDAIRNGAMRFGVALDLWSKSESFEFKPLEPSGTGSTSSGGDAPVRSARLDPAEEPVSDDRTSGCEPRRRPQSQRWEGRLLGSRLILPPLLGTTTRRPPRNSGPSPASTSAPSRRSSASTNCDSARARRRMKSPSWSSPS